MKVNITTTPEIVKMPKIDSLRANAAGFNKSLTLIQALIKDLDDKMSLIRHQKSWRNEFLLYYYFINVKILKSIIKT